MNKAVEIEQELRDEAQRLSMRAYGRDCMSPDCALASNLAEKAADLIKALRDLPAQSTVEIQRDLDWIVEQERYTFAECSLAEEIMVRVKRCAQALRDLPVEAEPVADPLVGLTQEGEPIYESERDYYSHPPKSYLLAAGEELLACKELGDSVGKCPLDEVIPRSADFNKRWPLAWAALRNAIAGVKS